MHFEQWIVDQYLSKCKLAELCENVLVVVVWGYQYKVVAVHQIKEPSNETCVFI